MNVNAQKKKKEAITPTGKKTIPRLNKAILMGVVAFWLLYAFVYGWPQWAIMTVVCGRQPVIGYRATDMQTYYLPSGLGYQSSGGLWTTYYCTETDAQHAGLRRAN